MAALVGVNIPAILVPFNDLDTFATVDPLYMKGSYRTVADITARDSITEERREEGMLVYVQSTQIIYQLLPGFPVSGPLAPGDWGIFGSASIPTSNFEEFAPPTSGQLVYNLSNTPSPTNSLQVIVNGLTLKTSDYTLLGSQVTLVGTYSWIGTRANDFVQFRYTS